MSMASVIYSILITVQMFFGTWAIDWVEIGAFAYKTDSKENMMVSFYEENACSIAINGETHEGMWYFEEEEQKGMAMFPGIKTVYRLEIVKESSENMQLRLTDTDDDGTIFSFSLYDESGR